MWLPIFPLTNILVSVWIRDSPETLFFAVNVAAFIYHAIRRSLGTLAMLFPIVPLTSILASVWPRESTEAFSFASNVAALIYAAILHNIGAFAML